MNERDFKGVYVLRERIKLHGYINAVIMSAVEQSAPGLSSWQLRKGRKLLSINNKKFMESEDIKNYITKNEGVYICDWCKTKCHSIQEHHYPISKKNNGKDKVNICGTCHADYHYIENYGIRGIYHGEM